MLVLKNGSNVMAEAGKPLVNNEVNALRIENTDRITIGFVTTGAIAISWGDGTVLNLGTQAARYNASKLYRSVGNWNIVITNPENVKELYFDITSGYGYSVTKINTQVGYFTQFCNLYYLNVQSSSFRGDIGKILILLPKLERIFIYQNLSYNPFTINISDCKSFWSRCKSMYIFSNANNFLIGKYDDIVLPLDCEKALIYNYSTLSSGDISGIIKSGYTKCVEMGYYLNICTMKDYPNTDDIVIPDTMKIFNPQRGLVSSVSGKSAHGTLINFNFKNLLSWSGEGQYECIDLSSNQSFLSFAKVCYWFANSYIMLDATKSVTIPLNAFEGNTNILSFYLSKTSLPLNNGANKSYGNMDWLFNQTSRGPINCTIDSGSNDGSVTGTIPENTTITNSMFGGIDITANSVAIKKIIINGPQVMWDSLPGFTGDISGADCSKIVTTVNSYGLIMVNMPNLYLDITTLVWGTNYTTLYHSIILRKSQHFTGNLANLALWANKSVIDLSSCAYTNIPGFIRKIFANRNTCLKASGGMTAIYVQGNVDNNQLTGIEQQPPLGTFAGNINDLTEVQIDNLEAGKDYTGIGTSTPWTDKECIWVMSKLKNSSTDSSLRYRCTFSY